jgi:thymidylate synthase
MNSNLVDSTYFRLLNTILQNGRRKKNRTGVETIGIFGEQAKFDVAINAFPILTTKKVWFKGIVHELLWFIKGDTNIKYLVDNGVHIWDEWAYKNYCDCTKINGAFEADKWMRDNGDGTCSMYTQEQFVDKVKTDNEFAKRWGGLGEGTYGGVWTDFPFYLEHKDYYNVEKPFVDFKYEAEGGVSMYGINQLAKVVDKLKTNPDDRRMIVSAWHPYWVDHCALPPCHCLFHFNTEELTLEERRQLYVRDGGFNTYADSMIEKDLDDLKVPKRKLNLLLYQRSCDTFLGVPFNITSYSLLLALVAHCVNMEPGTFTHTYGDLHIYSNHLDQVNLQLGRASKPLPKLWLNPEVNDLFRFKFDDIKLIDYDSHPKIEAPIAV